MDTVAYDEALRKLGFEEFRPLEYRLVDDWQRQAHMCAGRLTFLYTNEHGDWFINYKWSTTPPQDLCCAYPDILRWYQEVELPRVVA